MAKSGTVGFRGRLALGGITAVAGLGTAAYSLRRRFDHWAIDTITRPQRADYHRDPAEFGLPYEEVQFKSDDGVDLSGWLIRGSDTPEAATATIIMAHGYSGNKDATLGYAEIIQSGGYNVLMFDFRAHGLSGGEQTSVGFIEHRDVHGAISYLISRGLNRIGYIGFSLGAAVGIVSAALYPEIRGLIADSGFSRLSSPLEVIVHGELKRSPMLAHMAGLYGERLLARELGYNWREAHPVAVIERISPRPVMIIHSHEDELIPVSDAYTLFAAAAAPKELWVEHGGPHATGLFAAFHDEYRRRVLDFWRRVQW